MIFTPILSAASVSAADVQQITNFGSNPSGIGMYLYTPSNVVAKPPILVGIHACHGKGTDVCSTGNAFAQQADKYGFLLICPSAVSSDGCWDVHSNSVLTHNGGGDASGIVSMVNYVVQNKNGDVNRVYAAGHSSGGMMTNVMLGSYPEVFKAGAAFAGVPFACFAQGSVDSNGWNGNCATGKVTKTAAQWGDLVRAAYPGFSGARPRMQIWHGTTDGTVDFHNFGEEIKEWTNVLGVSEAPTSTENNALQSTWIRTRYAEESGVVQVEAIEETGQPHNLVVDAAEAIHFFGLDGSNPVPDAGAKDSGTNTGGSGSGGRGGGTGGTGLSGSGGTGDRGGGIGGVHTTVGSSGGVGGSKSIGSGGSTAFSAGAIGGSAGAGAVAGNGGSSGQGKGRSAGCSVHADLGERSPTDCYRPIYLLLALGFYRGSRRRRSGILTK
jgi:acetylxylan esterase